MKRVHLFFIGAILFAACNDASKTTDAAKTDSPTVAVFVPVDSATAEKNWMAYMTPGDVHKMIVSWDGKWNTEMSSWMSPDAPPMKSTGTSINKSVLGGRYQESVHTSTMMGMSFEGHGTLGYDNAKKVFESTWIDNFGTGIIKLVGAWDDATKSITLVGKCVDPASGKECEMREIFKVVDENTHTMEMYSQNPKDGKEMKMMEMKFVRAK
ncbi:MAG: DUF1579 domain-containing protein [Chitinophagaceae bacterium]|jgi:hypothetical protein|nr:DUF1579 domain-containing protein [Chitinophagaceae bacterium]